MSSPGAAILDGEGKPRSRVDIRCGGDTFPSGLRKDGLLPTMAYPRGNCNGWRLPSFNVAP